MSEQEPESDYTNVTVPDEELPEDLQAGEDNPLAAPSDDDADLQDLGDPHMPGLERDADEGLRLPDQDDQHDGGED